ncbi:hypothetical protein DL770_000546 [Monosporascus sp. CRB-9-2]|nr:hypothetical protein DL770_000546 [Monosporascus sp. CRB-9-2]
MPPKRQLADSNTNTQSGPARGRKQSKKTAGPAEDNASATTSGSGGGQEGNRDDDDLENRPPYEYYCLTRPFFDFENENEDKDEDEQLDEDEIEDRYNELVTSKDSVATKPAADHPDHKWISMWQAWKKYCHLKRHALYTNPDMFGMYIYNDFHGYGIQELVQNTLLAFDKEFSKKTRDDARLNEMWSITSSLVHWLLRDELGSWMMMDDGELLSKTISMIGLAFLAMLNELDLAKLLKADSRIKDLGLVMACYLEWSQVSNEYADDESDVDLPETIVAYAKKAGIELENAGVYGLKEKLSSIEEEKGEIEALSGNAKADRWAWKKRFNAFKRDHGITAGEKYNILKMSRKERASHAFDKKDPLKDVSDKDLREGNIMPV